MTFSLKNSLENFQILFSPQPKCKECNSAFSQTKQSLIFFSFWGSLDKMDYMFLIISKHGLIKRKCRLWSSVWKILGRGALGLYIDKESICRHRSVKYKFFWSIKIWSWIFIFLLPKDQEIIKAYWL